MNTILFVDDDRVLRTRVEKMFTLFKDQFKTLTAGDGTEAVKMLNEADISLVVTDLKMPHKDGFGLLAYLTQHYPDVPVIVVTGYSSSAARKLAQERGAVGFIAKPFELEALGNKIQQILKSATEGGILNSISPEVFSQLIEMEMKTCTLRVTDKQSGDMGVLFFREGVLMNARFKNVHGELAALKIFGWHDVAMSLQDHCPVVEKKIDSELQAVIMDAIRLRDEGVDPMTGYVSEAVDIPGGAVSEADRIREKLAGISGSENWLRGVAAGSQFDLFLTACSRIGKALKAGELKACYIHREGHSGSIAVPGTETSVVRVDISCPWDILLKALFW